jgi:peptidoglycan/LPS O-acetylase OafA/YrhL
MDEQPESMRAAEGKPQAAPDRRLRSLDGLRGVAAVVVLVHHGLLTIPLLAGAYYPDSTVSPKGDLFGWVFTYTPIHILWAGTEAVFLFFILSGIVLTLPVVSRHRFNWMSYYPKRVIRLYAPVVFAIGLGYLLILISPRYDNSLLGGWMNARPDEYPLKSVAKDLSLVTGTSSRISPLWSLQWEVLFSLLLPLFVLFCVGGRRFIWFKVGALMTLIVLGDVFQNQWAFFLPMFGIGALAAANWSYVAVFGATLARAASALPILVVVGILLTCFRWELLGLGVPENIASKFEWVAVLGVAMLVFAAAFWAPLKGFLTTKVILWLGKISFSLYLVHEPIIIAVRFALVELSPWAALALSVPLSFLVAILFSRLIEQPSHALAKKVGAAFDRPRRPQQLKVTPTC